MWAILVCAVLGTACLKAGKPTAYSTEDVFILRDPSHAGGLQLRGHVVRTNPSAQMITIAPEGAASADAAPVGAAGVAGSNHGDGSDHGGGHGTAAELTVPVEGEAVGALRTLRPGHSVTVLCRAIDSRSLQGRAAIETDAASAQASAGGGTIAGLVGLSAKCPSIIKVDRQDH